VWTRKAIADLTTTALEKSRFPYELRDQIWRVLEPLTRDSDPTSENERSEPPTSTMDPSTRSINTVSGQAMHGVVRYALWSRRQTEEEEASEKLNRGFDEMPEVRDVLNMHLDPEVEKTLAVRSVYGQWFPWLVLIDRQWVTKNVSRVFPPTEEEDDLWRAAWNAYVTFCRPYRDVLDVLKEEYGRAISRVGALQTQQRRPGSPDLRLGLHLISYAAQGLLEVREPEGLLAKFFAAAPADLRAEVVSSVGFDLYHATGLEADGIRRFKNLWEWRFEVTSANPQESRKELAAFGWWFASRKFDPEWSLDRLRKVLALAVMTESHHLVAEHLAELVEKHTSEVLECLRLLVENDKEEWLTSTWRVQARKILSFAIESTTGPTRDAAIDLVHRLGAKGLFEFRDLLPKKG
jgi:hypothetical protein